MFKISYKVGEPIAEQPYAVAVQQVSESILVQYIQAQCFETLKDCFL